MGTRISAPVETGPGTNPASCKMSTESFPGVKTGLGVLLTTHHLLVPWSRKSRAIPICLCGVCVCVCVVCVFVCECVCVRVCVQLSVCQRAHNFYNGMSLCGNDLQWQYIT